jgi:serine/threonine protein kinase
LLDTDVLTIASFYHSSTLSLTSSLLCLHVCIRQAGCILYAMLAGHPPFHPDVKYRSLCAKGKFYPLKGPNWDNISAEAKDLVTRMLTKDPAKRIDMDGICSHPWLVAAQTHSDACSEKALGEAYAKRIKNLVLKNKLKKCFLDTNIENETRNRRANFVKTLSMSEKSPNNHNPFEETSSSEKKNYCVCIADYVKTKEYNAKLLKVRAALVQHIYSTYMYNVAVCLSVAVVTMFCC